MNQIKGKLAITPITDNVNNQILNPAKKIRTATIHALAAYIITIFHKLDAIAFSPFVLVWILAYFLHIE